MQAPDRLHVRGFLDPATARILRRFEDVVVDASDRRRGAPVTIVSLGDVAREVRVESRRLVDTSAALALSEAASARVEPTVVVAHGITAEARLVLRHRGLGYAAASGHLWLLLPGLFVHVEAPRRARPPKRGEVRLSGAAGRVAQALLLSPGSDWGVRELARACGASLGVTHAVLTRLDTAGITVGGGSGRQRVRRVAGQEALLDLWCEEQTDPDVDVVRCYRPARSPSELAETASAKLGTAAVGHAVTRGAAVHAMTSGSGALATVEVWVEEGVEAADLLEAVGADEASDRANLILMRASGNPALVFAEKRRGIVCVNPVRLYYDLRHRPHLDPVQLHQLRDAIVGR